jgi:hypothetical protein
MEQIVSRDTIRARARAAFDSGASRDSHNMNPDAAALADWLSEYDRCAQAWHAELYEVEP